MQWPSQSSSQTIEQYFNAHSGRSAERYGESLVYAAYRVPADVREDKIATDIDTLIAEYLALLESIPTPQPTPTIPTRPSGVPAIGLSVLEEPSPERPYTVTEAAEGLFITQLRFEQILATWRQKKNLVVQGPPGVGKTYFYRRLAYALMGAEAPNRVAVVQFHPSYSYEDFVQGYRPSPEGFSLRPGVFWRFCERARSDPGRAYVFVIDEINRGNLAKVFGELLMLLEPDKRGEDWAMPLAYASADAPRFFVPKNVYLLGLMNTADRSLAVVDYALRRRFAFVSLQPEYGSERFREHLQEQGVDESLRRKIVDRMSALNDDIARDKANLGPGFCIGHSFFCSPPEDVAGHAEWYTQVVESEIAPLLREYYFDDTDRAQELIRRLL